MAKEGNVTKWASQVLWSWLLLSISIVLELCKVHLRTLHLGEERVEDSPPLGSRRTWKAPGWLSGQSKVDLQWLKGFSSQHIISILLGHH